MLVGWPQKWKEFFRNSSVTSHPVQCKSPGKRFSHHFAHDLLKVRLRYPDIGATSPS